ncbi:MAG: nucleotide exchange factor GrpE [Deltaproteobacteria bacterium]|jgi:molecular chaperone GrpE
MSLSESPQKGLHEPAAPEDQTDPQEAPEITNDPEELQRQLEEKTQEAQENYDRLLRLAADMENLRKRQEKERSDLLLYANENLIKELLPVVDSLERALDHGRQAEAPEAWLEGIDLVYQGFLKALAKFGVTPLESVGQQFDPAFHNAVMQEETTEFPDSSVTKELQKGYLLNQRLLRPAMVVVARHFQNENTSCQTDSTVQEEK